MQTQTQTDWLGGAQALSVRPEATTYELLLTARTAVSHHDATVQQDSNRMLFNRQKQFLSDPEPSVLADERQMAALAAAHPVPAEIADVFTDMPFGEFAAVTLTRLFLDLYNSLDGSGLFEGMERYERLETRMRLAAIVAPSLRAYWGRLCDSLQVGIHGGDHDAALFGLLSLPRGTQQEVLRVVSEQYRSVVAVARLWHTTAKRASEDYALAVGQPQITEWVTVEFAWPSTLQRAAARVVEVPTVSGNTLRHCVVRSPAWLHLAVALGLEARRPGQGELPPGAEALFVNGGNIASGAKAPSTAFALAAEVRERYPTLDLLGGVTDSFDLGESRLKVSGWVVCRENRDALRGSAAYDLPAASVSAFDMLDDVTLTRQAGLTGVGQMIYTFETLCAGMQVLVRLTLDPFTRPLTRGSLVAAARWYLTHDPVIGGLSGRGYGHVDGEMLAGPDDCAERLAEYEAYLSENRESLREGLVHGTLGTATVLVW